MTLTLYQIDAFSDRLFGGNPAAVVPLQRWLPDALLQAIAAENNLSETAFFVAASDATQAIPLRWFTPTNEVDLCGHATLAAAWVLFHALGHPQPDVRFSSTSGELRVARDGNNLVLDFPARPATPVATDVQVCRALGIPSDTPMLLARDLLVVLDNAEQVRQLAPDFAALARADYFGICVTARGDDCDFVSRFFAPRQGINEDPVTGSAHCTLAPYWQQELQRDTLDARQLSARGGVLQCRVHDGRVFIAGTARCYLHGDISLPDSIETLEN